MPLKNNHTALVFVDKAKVGIKTAKEIVYALLDERKTTTYLTKKLTDSQIKVEESDIAGIYQAVVILTAEETKSIKDKSYQEVKILTDSDKPITVHQGAIQFEPTHITDI